MEAFELIHYSPHHHRFSESEFEDAVHHSARCYSIRHLIAAGITSVEDISQALHRAMQVCSLAGIDPGFHFKKIYVYDVNNQSIYTNWLMTKKGLNLVLIQYPLLNESVARWLLDVAERK